MLEHGTEPPDPLTLTTGAVTDFGEWTAHRNRLRVAEQLRNGVHWQVCIFLAGICVSASFILHYYQ